MRRTLHNGGDLNMQWTHSLALDAWAYAYKISVVGLPCDESCTAPDVLYYDVSWDIVRGCHQISDRISML